MFRKKVRNEYQLPLHSYKPSLILKLCGFGTVVHKLRGDVPMHISPWLKIKI